jgi:hypothetical protein
VWDEIGARFSHSRAESPSEAYADYVATRRRDLDEMAAAFRSLPDQVGFVACIGEEVAGLEGIGRPEVFAQAFPGLLRGYLIDAVDHALVRGRRDATKPARRFDAPEPFVAALAEAPVEASASLGLGTDLRIEDGRVSASALVAGDAAAGVRPPAPQSPDARLHDACRPAHTSSQVEYTAGLNTTLAVVAGGSRCSRAVAGRRRPGRSRSRLARR